MASTSTTISLSSSSTLIDGKAPRPPPVSPPYSVTLPPVAPQNRQQNRETWKATAYCRKIARNVIAMATGESQIKAAAGTQVEVETEVSEIVNTVQAEGDTELPEIVKTIQAAWDKVDDKYAVTSLGVAGFLGLWVSSGMISSIDRLPLVPGVLELVGIGYTGWFAYRNLIFQPEREALIQKIKDTYNDILGSS
ncbi:photosystem I P subunit [Tasmannia lanceolata]|uniref:photosystem I P subunit n=1 Tax=Tasmannia lanceolata TaxID=3420 RepID=UPI004062EA9B